MSAADQIVMGLSRLILTLRLLRIRIVIVHLPSLGRLDLTPFLKIEGRIELGKGFSLHSNFGILATQPQ